MNTYNTPIPREYILGKVQGREEDFTIYDLTRFQSHMLGYDLKVGKIQTFTVEESRRLQEIKTDRLGIFHHHDCIPLRHMGDEQERDIMLSTLESLGASSNVFDRYTDKDHYPRELRLDESLFRRLGIQAYKHQLVRILNGSISASISKDLLLEITKNKLKIFGCTEKYLESFIAKNRT